MIELAQHQKSLLDTFGNQITALTQSNSTQFAHLKEDTEKSIEKWITGRVAKAFSYDYYRS
jgi:hypothetical protein